MFSLLNARRGRKAVISLLGPLVSRSRRSVPGLQGEAWDDPYVIGFVATTITLVVKRTVRGISSDAIGSVQMSAWLALTGRSGEVFGESIYLLSSDRNPAFRDGCRNAAAFIERCDLEDPTWPATAATDQHTAAVMSRNWERFFESYCAERLVAG